MSGARHRVHSLTRDRPRLTVGVAVATGVGLVAVLFAVSLAWMLGGDARGESREQRALRAAVTSLHPAQAKELGGVHVVCGGRNTSAWTAVRRIELPGPRTAALAVVTAEARHEGWVDGVPGVFHRPGQSTTNDGIHLLVAVTGSNQRPIVSVSASGRSQCF